MAAPTFSERVGGHRERATGWQAYSFEGGEGKCQNAHHREIKGQKIIKEVLICYL